MSIEQVDSIELDMELWGKAYIVWRRKDGSVVRKMQVKWEKKDEAFQKAHAAWYEAKFGGK